MFLPHICIIGGGSVGSTLFAYIKAQVPTFTLEIHDPLLQQQAHLDKGTIFHITVPYLSYDQYYDMIVKLFGQIPKKSLVIIHSTLNPKLIRELCNYDQFDLYYNPIRVPENDMATRIGEHVWYFANIHKQDSFRMKGYLDLLRVTYKEFPDAAALAYGKLLETTQFGMQIAFVQMIKRICDEQGWDFDTAYTHYQELSNYRRDYSSENKYYIPRPIFVPNKIGGKCVMQNLKIVDDNDLADLNFIEFIMESNDKVQSNENN
jgi:hypothetical protein